MDNAECGFVAFMLFLIALLIIVFSLPFSNCKGSCACKKEPFTNVYRYWSKKLKELKEPPFDLGNPPGVLMYSPEKCDPSTNRNYVPQSKIAFRPTQRMNGCTYLDMRYPG